MDCKNTKNRQIQKLFDINAKQLLAADVTTPVKKNGICYDGIVDETKFASCSKKVIFLLKETNGNTKIKDKDKTIIGLPEILDDWDYRKWLQEQADNNLTKFYGFTFNKLCMWLDIFYDCLKEKDIPFEEYYQNKYNEKNFRELLALTGIVNLKKTWGGATTDRNDLYSYLHQENNKIPTDVLKKEIEIISPDVVICGGNQVFEFSKEIFCGESVALKLADGKELKYFKNENTVFLDFYHPACRGSIEKLYDYAKLRFNKIKSIL